MVKYPRKGRDNPARPTQQCQVCRVNPAYRTLDIETTYMRGDDEVFRVCKECLKLSAEEIIIKASESNVRHVAEATKGGSAGYQRRMKR